MRRKVYFYSICFAFGLSVIIILAGSRYTDNVNDYEPSSESRRNESSFAKTDGGEDSSLQPITTDTYDGSPNKILLKTRSQIKFELSKCNLTITGVKKIEDLTLETGGKPVRNIIVSTWRSGSSFLGAVLNSMPGNFFHFEPLVKYGTQQIRGGSPYADDTVSTIKKMLKCDFSSGMDYYFEYSKTHTFQFCHNTRLWNHCKNKIELCLDANFTSRFCKLFPFQSMKLVRVRLSVIQDILEDKELNTKVVLLIRDPRAVMQSRQHCVWCPPAPDCWKPELLCADMVSDYAVAGRLIQKYPDQLIVLRYEELAMTPYVTSHQLFKFLRLGAIQSVDEFLHTHTNVKKGDDYSSFRVSRDVPFRWKNVLEYSYVEEIQGVCKEAMSLWGYKMANNVTHMMSKDFNPLEPGTELPQN